MITIERAQLKAAGRFIAADATRPVLAGVLVEASPAGVRLVATDGHALLVARTGADVETDTWTGIIPADVIKAALAWKGSKDLPIILIPGAPECRLTRATGEALVFVPVVGTFPNYRKVVPAAVDGAPAFYNPDLLVRFKRAAEDLGSRLGYFELAPGGNGSGLVYINENVMGVIMPIRSTPPGDTAWAREGGAE